MRTVKVKLEADTEGFKEPVRSAKESVKDLDDKVEALDHDLNKIPPDAAKAALAVKALGDGAKNAANNLQTIGDKSAGLAVLDQKIAASRNEVKKLTEEFIKTGDVEVFKKLGKAAADTKNLESVRKKLSKTIEDGLEEGGKEGFNLFSSIAQKGIMSTFDALPPEAKAAVIAIVSAAALAAIPIIVAAIDAALLAGLGFGGLAAGIALAVKDANVEKVFADLGSHIMTTLQHAVTPFRSELVGAAMIFQTSFDKITPSINRIFNTLSKAIEPIASGLGKLMENAAPGLEQAFQGALPLLREFGEWLPKLGTDIGDLGHALAEAEPEAQMFFKFLLANVDVAIKTITFLTEAVHGLVGGLMLLTGQYQPISPALATDTTAMNDLGDAAQSTKDDIASIGDAFSQVGQSAEGVLTGKILDSMFALDDATIRWSEALNKVNDKIEKNGTSLDLNSDKGAKNAKVILDAAKANAELYQQNLLSGKSADEAAAIYDKNAETLRKQAIQAGFAAKDVDNLIGKYKNVPEKVQTILATIGLTDALNHLSQILIDFRNLNDKDFKTKYTITTEYIVKHTGTVGGKEGPAKYAQGGYRRAAVGMYIPPSDPGTTLIGEPQTGGEYLIPARGIGQSRAWDLLQMAGAGYGLNVAPRNQGGAMKVEHTLAVVDGSHGRSGLATLVAQMARTGELQITSRAIVN